MDLNLLARLFWFLYIMSEITIIVPDRYIFFCVSVTCFLFSVNISSTAESHREKHFKRKWWAPKGKYDPNVHYLKTTQQQQKSGSRKTSNSWRVDHRPRSHPSNVMLPFGAFNRSNSDTLAARLCPRLLVKCHPANPHFERRKEKKKKKKMDAIFAHLCSTEFYYLFLQLKK